MTYGVYTNDLKGVSINDTDFETAKSWCSPNHVVCSEKIVTTGFEVRIRISKYWEFRVRPQWGILNLGWLKIEWRRTTQLWADKVVWDPEKDKEVK